MQDLPFNALKVSKKYNVYLLFKAIWKIIYTLKLELPQLRINVRLTDGLKCKNHLSEVKEVEYYSCSYCKAVLPKKYLKRHAKVCPKRSLNKEKSQNKFDYVSRSHSVISCNANITNTISKLNIRKQVKVEFLFLFYIADIHYFDIMICI